MYFSRSSGALSVSIWKTIPAAHSFPLINLNSQFTDVTTRNYDNRYNPETIDNNLGQDRLAGPIGPITIADIQPFDNTACVWKSSLCLVMSFACFGKCHFPYSYYIFHKSDIAAVNTLLTSFAMTTIINQTKNLTSNLMASLNLG